MASTNTNENVATPEMLNAIASEASETYQANVPVATALNLTDVGNPILTYTAMANEFLDALVNKIIATIVYRQMWESPLAVLRKDPEALGTDVEELQTNPADARDYDGTSTGLADILTVSPPDTKAAWYRLNRQDKYKVTINNEQLTNAFTSWGALENFIGSITDSLYNGNTISEYNYTKQIVTDAYGNNRLQSITTVAPTDETTTKQFMSTLRNLSLQFTFPSSNYNNYTLMGGTGNPRISWSPIDRQVILVRADVASTVGVELLSAAFNLNYTDYLARQIIVDQFDTNNQILAVLCDERAFQIREKLRRFATFYNASGLSWQYYYHAWDTFSLSPFHNIICLVAPSDSGDGGDGD